MLAPLAMNGGLTATHLPLASSPAVNAGGSSPPGTDQRGSPRPVGDPDLGAVELTVQELCNLSDFYGQWALTHLAAGDDISPGAGPDGDRLPNGIEFGNGTHPGEPSFDSPLIPTVLTADQGDLIQFSLGRDPAADPFLLWKVTRSSDLQNSTVIYQRDGATGQVLNAPGVAVTELENRIVLTDQNAPRLQAFYQLEVTMISMP